MPHVKFTANRVVQDHRYGTPDEEKYTAGQVYELPFASAERWKRRGVAVDATPEEIVAYGNAPRKIMREPRPAKNTPPPSPSSTAPAPAASPPSDKPPESDIPPQSGVVPIPEDWNDLAWPKFKKLAQDISDRTVNDRVTASRIIQAEVDKRAKDAANAAEDAPKNG